MIRPFTHVVLASALAGCAGDGSPPRDAGPEVSLADVSADDTPAVDGAIADGAIADSAVTDAPTASLVLESPAFVDGGTLPVEHTCDGAGRSPPLSWRGAPAQTAEYALMMTVVARDGMKWNWVLYGIPPETRALPAGAMGVGTAGLTSDGPNLAYAPPCSQGPGPMRYTLSLYALSARPVLPAAARMVTGAVLTTAIAGLTLARSSVAVTYTR